MKFAEFLDKQAELNSRINVSRTPDKYDAINSLNAEIMEWNEASKATHKIWKDKKYHEENQFMEYIDILICLARYCNKFLENISTFESPNFTGISDTIELLDYHWEEWEKLSKVITSRSLEPATTSTFMKVVLSEDPVMMIQFYIITALRQGYDREQIEIGFLDKIEINKHRIGGDWN